MTLCLRVLGIPPEDLSSIDSGKLMEFILCCPCGHGTCPGVWLMHPVAFQWRKQISPAQWVSIANSFLVRILCLLPILCARILSHWNMCRSCACCHNLWKFLCLSALLCLEDSVSFESSTTSGPHIPSVSSSDQISEPWELGVTKKSYLRLSVPESLILCTVHLGILELITICYKKTFL